MIILQWPVMSCCILKKAVRGRFYGKSRIIRLALAIKEHLVSSPNE
jgi:hypothetical protein